MTNLLYGIHDREGRGLVPAGGWCVDTVALSGNPAPTDYAALRSDINWIVRLNWGYGSTGTIPLPKDDAGYFQALERFVSQSKGAYTYIIGNEPNHEQERPNGEVITPQRYASFYNEAAAHIKRISPGARCCVAAPAPYHADPQTWTSYITEVLELVEPSLVDDLALHAYARSSSPNAITNTTQMQDALAGTFYGFLTYRDYLACVPPHLAGRQKLLTEFAELLPDGWDNRNTGIVQAAYGEINGKVSALVLYRWPRYDRWYIEGKQGVIDDFNAAVAKGYQSPDAAHASDAPFKTVLPKVSTGGDSPPAPMPEPSRDIDPRLKARGINIGTPAILRPGEYMWRLVKARWWNEQEAGGRHHIYVEALDENGQPLDGVPFNVAWPNGFDDTKRTNGRSGFDAGNFPMSKSLNEFSVVMSGGGYPSERVNGIGMGADGNSGIHTSTGLTFQRVTVPVITPGQPPLPTLPPAGPPAPIPSVPAGIIDPLVLEAIALTESNGDGFGADGRLKIRLEGHLLTGPTYGNPAVFANHFSRDTADPLLEYYRRSEGEPWIMYHGNQNLEHQAFEFAKQLDPAAALRCISMGAGQVMGFNAKRVGFGDPATMYAAFQRGELPQIMAIVGYCLSDPSLVAAMAAKDWNTITRLYNGKGLEHIYAPRLIANYQRIGGKP